MSNTRCLIDGSEGVVFAEQFGWRYVACPLCSLQWADSMPSPVELERLYGPASGYQRHHAKKPIDRNNPHYRKLISIVTCARSTPARALDVGCSAGDVAVPLAERGYVVDGVEPNETTASVAARRGVGIVGRHISDVDASVPYDIVIASEVIEHVLDPGAFAAHLKRVLASDGVCILSTPNTSSVFARLMRCFAPRVGIPVSYLTAPYHLTYFDGRNLQRLLEAHGFSSFQFSYRCGPSLRYELGNLHLWGAYRRARTVRSLIRLLFGFSVTTVAWSVDRIATLLGWSGFQMYVVASVNTKTP